MLLRHQYPGGQTAQAGFIVGKPCGAGIQPQAMVVGIRPVAAHQLVAACSKSLRRFFPANFDDLPPDFVGYTTPNGWQVTKADLLWFAQQSLTPLNRPENMMVILKQGDDLLDYRVSEHYFRQQHVANIIVEADAGAGPTM